jgi:hypothetical protein
MTIYIIQACLIVALVICWGFLLGRSVLIEQLENELRDEAYRYYLKQYNYQMGELCIRYRQERLAIIHRYEGAVSDIQNELDVLRRHIDLEPTEERTVIIDDEKVGA